MPGKFKTISRRSIALFIVAVLVVAGGAIYAQNRSKMNNPIIPSTNPIAQSQKPVPKTSADNRQTSTDNNPSSQTVISSGPPPQVPTGDFVSNHKSSGSTTSESSTCNTSPGASCYIQFTNGLTTKKLQPEIVDARGSAIWYWDIKSAGLTSGSWDISAIATQNGQTKTAYDARQLVIE